MAEYASINKINEKSIENDNQMELTNFDAIYNECVNYLKDEKLNINFEKEPDYESIEEVEKGDISTEEEMNRDIINENKRSEENINEYNNNEEERFEEEINDNDLNGEDSKEELSNTEQHEESFEEIINTNQAPKNQDQRIVPRTIYQIENELISESLTSIHSEGRSERLRKLSIQLPKIIITQSNSSLNVRAEEYRLKERENMLDYKLEDRDRHILKTNSLKHFNETMHKTSVGSKFSNHGFFGNKSVSKNGKSHVGNYCKSNGPTRKSGYGDHPKRLVCKRGVENVALITNVPFERIRLLNDTFHTLINLRWRWIVTGTIVVHFAIWLVFAVFWYITAWAHYDFEPDAPARTCVTGGHDFLTIFLASVEAQTTIGFGDRAIDEECPESIFLFIMQLILGTGLSGVLTCVVYAKLTRPEKLSRDGVGFSKKAVISIRDGHLCLMVRAWDLNYDHIISSEFSAHFIHTHRTKEGEVLRYYAESLLLQQRQFLLWPVTLVHVIDRSSPLYRYSPDHIATSSYEITISLKGASASMGTFTQSQTSYLPKEVVWGHRFPPVVKYDARKQKYVIDHKKLDLIEPIDTPFCSAYQLNTSSASSDKLDVSPTPGTPTSFSEQISSFQLGRSSSFRRKGTKT